MTQREWELWIASWIRLMQREEACQCDEPSRPIGVNDARSDPLFRDTFAHHCSRCMGSLKEDAPVRVTEESHAARARRTASNN